MIRRFAERAERARGNDAGFTIVEVVVAIAIVTVVMTSLAAFFVSSGRITNNQGERQAATQIAESGMDKARSLSAVGAVHNRDKSSSDTLWAAGQNTSSATKFPGVAAYLTNVGEAYDTSSGLATNAGYTAPLPTNGNTVTLGSTTYTQNWFLGYCVRSSTGTCSAGTVGTGNSVYLQVVVAVTWPDNACKNSLCSYVTVGLISQTLDPVFDQSQGAPKPRINNPGNQSNEVGTTVNLPITTSGGTAPLTWTTPTLPAGLVWDTTTSPVSIHGSPTSTAGSPITVTLQVTDTFGYVSTAAFTWTITPGPTITAVSDRTGDRTGTAVLFTVALSGGIAAYNWSGTTGLPPGISITGTGNVATISGTPTQAGTFPVSIKVTDAKGATDTETFNWAVQLGGSVGASSVTGPSSGKYTCTWAVDVNGDAPFTWTASDAGISIVTSNGTKHAVFSIKVPYGTYTYTFQATQTATGGTLNGSTTCYAGTK